MAVLQELKVKELAERIKAGNAPQISGDIEVWSMHVDASVPRD